MTQLASYVFKPKHGNVIAQRIIQTFCDNFLNWEDEGFYLHWRTAEDLLRNGTAMYRTLPEDHIEFTIETDGGNMEAWTETCFSERELEASDLTDSFFAMLPQDFWETFKDGKPCYHFYERELAEVVACLAADDSRVVSFGGGRQAWVSEGERYKTIDLLDYAMTVPIVKETQSIPQDRQLQLTL